jgi:hypothetical protein
MRYRKVPSVFKDAEKLAMTHQAELLDQLTIQVDGLEKTATSWFDDSSTSITRRQGQLRATAGMCYRYASSMSDDIDRADMMGFGDELQRQASELDETRIALAHAEYDHEVGTSSAIFSSPLGDESRLASRRDTDWDLFMSIEPREFVASNESAIDNAQEMKIRAFAFMQEATSGHGFNRTAKQDLTGLFLTKVEEVRSKFANKRTAAAQTERTDFEDSALYF